MPARGAAHPVGSPTPCCDTRLRLARRRAAGPLDAALREAEASGVLPWDACLTVLTCAHKEGMTITVKTLTGSVFTMPYSPCMLVREVKDAIEERAGIPVSQQRLVAKARQLENDRTLYDYGVVCSDPIHVVLRLRGGGGYQPLIFRLLANHRQAVHRTARPVIAFGADVSSFDSPALRSGGVGRAPLHHAAPPPVHRPR